MPGPLPHSERVERCRQCNSEVVTRVYVDIDGNIARIIPPHAGYHDGYALCRRSLTARRVAPKHPTPKFTEPG